VIITREDMGHSLLARAFDVHWVTSGGQYAVVTLAPVEVIRCKCGSLIMAFTRALRWYPPPLSHT